MLATTGLLLRDQWVTGHSRPFHFISFHFTEFHFAEFQIAETLFLLLLLLLTLGDLGFGELKFGEMKGHPKVTPFDSLPMVSYYRPIVYIFSTTYTLPETRIMGLSDHDGHGKNGMIWQTIYTCIEQLIVYSCVIDQNVTKTKFVIILLSYSLRQSEPFVCATKILQDCQHNAWLLRYAFLYH